MRSTITIEKTKQQLGEALRNVDASQIDVEIEKIQDQFLPQMPHSQAKCNALKSLYQSYLNDQQQAQIGLMFTTRQRNYLLSIPDATDRKLLFALMAWQQLHPHSSEWIDFDEAHKQKNILALTFSPEELVKINRQNFQRLRAYGFDLQIRGKKQAVICYHLSLPDLDDFEGDKVVVVGANRKELLDFLFLGGNNEQ